MKQKGILVDRDGVLIQERFDYVKSIAEVSFIPGVEEAIAQLWKHQYIVCVVTNQAGISKGLYSSETVEEIHAFIEQHFYKYGHGVIAWYFCPHQDKDNCVCRKPRPGLLIKAMEDHHLVPLETWMVGDNNSDIEAGMSAGCKTSLVQTGYGPMHIGHVKSDLVIADFSQFVDSILKLY
jgi:D-glycero-D-manno-heptose 1,7-bisphosphate phosphatase